MKTASTAIKPGNKPVNSLKKDGIAKRFWKTRFLFLLFLPTLAYYIIFAYIPMWGVSMAFMEYDVWGGLATSKWVGFKQFELFFRSPMAVMTTKNTLVLGLTAILFEFPTTIVFSLLLNEIRGAKFKKVAQTVSYLPHFLSTVIMCAMINTLLDPSNGGINLIITALGGEPIYFMTRKEWFIPVWIISDIWKGLGWSTIVYLAAISSVDPGLYEAARLDGAGRIRQMASITLPSILPTVTTMLVLKFGQVMNQSMEKALLLTHTATYEVSTILSTYAFNMSFGMISNFSLAQAINLYTAAVNLALLLITNFISEKLTDNGIL